VVRLWLAERDDMLTGYDEFVEWVVAAETVEQAADFTGYAEEKGFKIRPVGVADSETPCGIVLGSFNAG